MEAMVRVDQDSYTDMAACNAALMAEAEGGIDWCLKQANDDWDLYYNEIKTLMEVDYPNGGYVDPDRYTPDVGFWIATQREEYEKRRKGHACLLSDERIEKLEAIGFWWDGKPSPRDIFEPSTPEAEPVATSMELSLRDIFETSMSEADSIVASMQPSPRDIFETPTPEAEPIAATMQQVEQKKGRPSRQSKEWSRFFEELKTHVEHHESCLPGQCPYCSKELGRWVQDQRNRYWEKQNNASGSILTKTISDFHIRQLEGIDFDWGEDPNPAPKPNLAIKKRRTDTLSSLPQSPVAHEAKKRKRSVSVPWETYYARLVDLKKNNGGVYIDPPNSDPKFCNWVREQRYSYRKTMEQGDGLKPRISYNRIALLEEIGFPWEKPGETAAAEESQCDSDDETVGYCTQEEEESHHSSNSSTNGLVGGDGILDTPASKLSHASARFSVAETTLETPRQSPSNSRGAIRRCSVSETTQDTDGIQSPCNSNGASTRCSIPEVAIFESQETHNPFHQEGTVGGSASISSQSSVDAARQSPSSLNEGSIRCTVSESTMLESQNVRRNLFQAMTAETGMENDVGIHENLSQMSGLCRTIELAQKRKEQEWEKKDKANRESLREAEKEIKDLRTQKMQKEEKLEKEIRLLRRRVKELQDQNAAQLKKSDRYQALRHAYKIERERRIEAEAKLDEHESNSNAFSIPRHQS